MKTKPKTTSTSKEELFKIRQNSLDLASRLKPNDYSSANYVGGMPRSLSYDIVAEAKKIEQYILTGK